MQKTPADVAAVGARPAFTVTEITRQTLERAGFRAALRWYRDGHLLTTDEALASVVQEQNR